MTRLSGVIMIETSLVSRFVGLMRSQNPCHQLFCTFVWSKKYIPINILLKWSNPASPNTSKEHSKYTIRYCKEQYIYFSQGNCGVNIDWF